MLDETYKLEKGCTYLFEQGGYSQYPRIDRGKCLEVTETLAIL